MGLLGYNTSIILDASTGIWGTPTSFADEAEAITSFEESGITVLNTADILAMDCDDGMADNARLPSAMGLALLMMAAAVDHPREFAFPSKSFPYQPAASDLHPF